MPLAIRGFVCWSVCLSSHVSQNRRISLVQSHLNVYHIFAIHWFWAMYPRFSRSGVPHQRKRIIRICLNLHHFFPYCPPGAIYMPGLVLVVFPCNMKIFKYNDDNNNNNNNKNNNHNKSNNKSNNKQVRIPKTRCGCQGAARWKRLTDELTDLRTDTPSYKDAWPHLKTTTTSGKTPTPKKR